MSNEQNPNEQRDHQLQRVAIAAHNEIISRKDATQPLATRSSAARMRHSRSQRDHLPQECATAAHNETICCKNATQPLTVRS